MKKPKECDTNNHDYFALSSAYYKKTGFPTALGQSGHNQAVAYAMLCCRKCGATKEVISADHRKEET